MAIAFPPDATTPKDIVCQPGLASWRLPRHHAQDLRDVACGLEESDAGIRTRYLMDGEDHDRAPAFDHTPLHDVEAFCERFDVFARDGANQWRAGVRRCRAALRRMQRAGGQHHVSVLHVVHGPRDPFVKLLDRQVLDAFGELAALLRYTQTTEDRRRALVREALARDAALFPSGVGRIIQLADYRERERFLERVTSSGDAVRAALAPFADAPPRPRPDESRSGFDTRQRAFAERSRAHADRRRSFLDGGRRDADEMLTRASRAYSAAWQASAAD